MEFFKKALEISDKMVSLDKFTKLVVRQGWNEKDATSFTNFVFKTILPWIVEVLSEICSRVTRTPEEDAKFIYLYVAVFNCMKRLIRIYVTYKVRTLQEIKNILQPVSVAALSFTLKAMDPDEARDECYKVSIPQLEKFCAGSCPKEFLVEIEAEMFTLSDYMPCMAEYKEMSYVINNAKLRVE